MTQVSDDAPSPSQATMREYSSRSASAAGSHGQGTELQSRGKSKGKRPDRRLYTPDQLSHLRASRPYQPDVAGEASDQRILNTPQSLNLPGNQLPRVTAVNLAPFSAGAMGSTLNTPPSAKPFHTRLPRPQPTQLLRAQLAGSPRVGSQHSGVGNVRSTPDAAAIGSTLDTHPRVELPRTHHPPSQTPRRQLPRAQVPGSALRGSRPPGASNVGSTPPDDPAIGSTAKIRPRVKPTRPQRLRGQLSHDPRTHSPPSGKQPSGLKSIEPNRKASAMGANQTAKTPRSQPSQSQLPPSLLPLPRNPDSRSHLSALSKISSTSRAKALANRQTSKLPQTHLPLNHLSPVNSTNPSVGNTPDPQQQPKLPGNQLPGRQSSGADSMGPIVKTSTMRSTVKKSRDFYNTKAEDSGMRLQPKRCFPAQVQPTSGTDVMGSSSATKAATRRLSFDRDSDEYSGTHLQQKTSNRAEVHRDRKKDPKTISPRRKAPSSQIGSGNHKNLSASSSMDSLRPKPLNIVKKNGPQRFAANPPQIPTPPLPTPPPQTVEGDRRVPIDTHLYTLACLTGSSLAGFSRSAEGSEDDDMQRSPSSERRGRQSSTRSSRTERNGQSDILIFRPEHTYTGGAGFPHRAAFTSSQANLFPNTQHQHPTPLSSDHVPPFRNSPPTPPSTGVGDTPP